ncbi:nitroreductase family protein [Glaesserella parasuis]|uniref:nitroreductase family protein n=1 Tax=Glaesserella parasuis TaxID=738 RepID=UPI00094FB606|nr:nitroreductase family protein [Glaesserella parasuis]MDG6263581.1 nitroreductase family protein [Glaesserella parasuis]MDG6284366.1 nitroreductase family protein [Glaesserella parasuis]MDG6312179.1 nitroreductase family protein [Glaesserella parasuis]MDG6314312.1 nitroreductase family protein [Glaesserella parasuis]MDG6327033.1 nitroreductase family protein [Glaesserella parasuis]
METLDLLQRRRSSKKFGQDVPNAEQLENMFKAAVRAPDHGRLKPYHFVVIEPTAMETFRRCLLETAQELEMGDEGVTKAEKLAKRAPMVIGVIAKIAKDLPKVPAWEQMVTAGCATYAMQLAANVQGFETCWITNKWIKGQALRQAFGCQADDEIVALLLLGSPLEGDSITTASQTEEITDFVSYIK